MTARRIASAPGKVVLSGEYAVLDGAPAICMAVDRRAVVTLTPGEGTECVVRAPGFVARDGRCRAQDGSLHWIAGQRDFAIVDAIWSAGARLPGGCTMELDTRAFFDEATGHKTGIGSSAALTAALVAALGTPGDVFAAALCAHRHLQGGAGSGVDVAAAVCGGLIEYRMGTADVRPLTFPGGLGFRVVFSGVAANTGARLATLARGKGAPSRAALTMASAGMAEAWASGKAATVLDAYPAYVESLRRFDVDHGLGIFDAGHDRLADAAQRAGLVYKPAGAGGGDIGVLFGTDAEGLDEFVARHVIEPQRVLPCREDARGVIVEVH